METQPPDWIEPPVVLARFARLQDAREAGLVMAAAGIAYGIVREGREWVVQVESTQEAAAGREWSLYEGANPGASGVEPQAASSVRGPVSMGSLWGVACWMVFFAVVQAEREPAWRETGVLSGGRIWEQGQWWRVVTALTLHANVAHVLANLASGLWFVRWLIPALGAGLAWLAVVCTGALGNAATAWFYYPADHQSLGASTAVFGALGLLTGEALGGLFSTRAGRSWWRWVLPLGAGLALLAFLGAGGAERERVDVAAHLWGFAAGVPLGVVLGWARAGERVSGRGQILCGTVAAAVVCGAWVWGLWQT